MVLSIGMIVKNEEKYLERCLTALKPILENIDSELIIADTGSTDKTVEIAKKFTNNVFHFEWINDFAAARNSTLERAKGEWYMFIDADEIMKDCSDIIRFFKSGEYKAYGSANYIVRSFFDLSNENLYSDFRPLRLTAKKNDICFKQPIHEGFDQFFQPCKFLNVAAEHYGYAFRDSGNISKVAEEKNERNLKILLEQLEIQKATGKIMDFLYAEIADCYIAVKDNEKAIEYLDRGLAETDQNNIAIIRYYSKKASVLFQLNRFQELNEICETYFSRENTARQFPLATDAFMYAMLGYVYFNMGAPTTAINKFVECFRLYHEYIENRLNTPELMFGIYEMSNSGYKACFALFLKLCVNQEQFETAAAWLKHFDFSDMLNNKEYMATYIYLRVEIMEHTSFSSLAELYNKLDDYNKKQLIAIMRWHLFKTHKPDSAVKSLKTIAKGDVNTEDATDIFRRFLVKKDLTPEAVNGFISKHGILGNEDVWVIMLLSNYDITPYITINGFDPERYVHEIYNKYINSQNTVDLFVNYNINAISPQGLEKAAGVYGWAMIGALQNELDTSALFEKYGEIGLRWYNEFPDSGNIPGDIKVAVIVNGITSARKTGNYALCTSEMRKLVTICSALAPIVSDYSKSLQKDIGSAPTAPDPEFTKLAEQLKQNIRALIGAGDISSAGELIGEFEELCPDDPEISVLRKQIEAEK